MRFSPASPHVTHKLINTVPRSAIDFHHSSSSMCLVHMHCSESSCPLSYYNQLPSLVLPSPTVLGEMMLSLACSSLSRQGELILKGGGRCLGRGLWVELRRGRGWRWGWRSVCKSVLEETALSWVTSRSRRAGGGEVTFRPGVHSNVLREHVGEVWSRSRWVAE